MIQARVAFKNNNLQEENNIKQLQKATCILTFTWLIVNELQLTRKRNSDNLDKYWSLWLSHLMDENQNKRLHQLQYEFWSKTENINANQNAY